MVEAMKMQHVIKAPSDGVVVEIYTEPGMTLDAGQAILLVRPTEGAETEQVELVEARPKSCAPRPKSPRRSAGDHLGQARTARRGCKAPQTRPTHRPGKPYRSL